MKKIAVGDLGEFWYGDYKEPFEQLEGGVPGHPVGVVLKADDGKLLCAWCGKTFENLGSHVNWAHRTSAREYKEQVGLLNKSALVSERIRLTHARTAQRVGFAAHPEHIRGYVAGRRSPTTHGLRKPERLNKTGTCYAQTLAVGRTVLRETGRLNERTLRKHGIFETVVRRYFGDMDGFRRALGMAPVNFTRHSDGQLVSALRNLAKDLGRTPARTDMRRFGLPSARLYARRFGSWTKAVERAGLIPDVPIAKRDDFEAMALETYATLGSITATARHLHVDRVAVERVFARYGAPFVVYGHPGGGADNTARKQWAAEMARRLSSSYRIEPAA